MESLPVLGWTQDLHCTYRTGTLSCNMSSPYEPSARNNLTYVIYIWFPIYRGKKCASLLGSSSLPNRVISFCFPFSLLVQHAHGLPHVLPPISSLFEDISLAFLGEAAARLLSADRHDSRDRRRGTRGFTTLSTLLASLSMHLLPKPRIQPKNTCKHRLHWRGKDPQTAVLGHCSPEAADI